MEKELHIWLGARRPIIQSMYISLEETEEALNNNVSRVDTTQTHVCSTHWIKKGYRIFVHMLNGEVVEMKLGYIKNCAKEIRPAHNLEKMLIANCFGLARREQR